jgi:hypothetical protein
VGGDNCFYNSHERTECSYEILPQNNNRIKRIVLSVLVGEPAAKVKSSIHLKRMRALEDSEHPVHLDIGCQGEVSGILEKVCQEAGTPETECQEMGTHSEKS